MAYFATKMLNPTYLIIVWHTLVLHEKNNGIAQNRSLYKPLKYRGVNKLPWVKLPETQGRREGSVCLHKLNREAFQPNTRLLRRAHLPLPTRLPSHLHAILRPISDCGPRINAKRNALPLVFVESRVLKCTLPLLTVRKDWSACGLMLNA